MADTMDPLAIRGLPEIPAHTPLAGIPVVGFDVETTGLEPREHEIACVGLAVKTGPLAEIVCKCRSITPEAAKVNGFTIEHLSAGVLLKDAAGVIDCAFLGRVVVGHNVGFDLSFLLRSTLASIPAAIDTACVGRLLFPGKPMRLANLCEYLGVQPGGHRAMGDAWASLQCWVASIPHLVKRGVTTWGELHAAQVEINPRHPRLPWPNQFRSFRKSAPEPEPTPAPEPDPDPLDFFGGAA